MSLYPILKHKEITTMYILYFCFFTCSSLSSLYFVFISNGVTSENNTTVLTIEFKLCEPRTNISLKHTTL